MNPVEDIKAVVAELRKSGSKDKLIIVPCCVYDNARHIAKEHNIRDVRIQAGIKLGDEVWFFSNDEIKKGRLREYHSNFVDVVVREVNAAGRVVFGHYYPNTNSIFPSREALCEHYRKIFE